MKARKIISVLMLPAMILTLVPAVSFTASAAPGTSKIVSTSFPTERLVVADFDVTETELDGQWVDPTGAQDATGFIQAAIDACAGLSVVNFMFYCPGASASPPRVAYYNYHIRNGQEPSLWEKIADFFVRAWQWIKEFFLPVTEFFRRCCL